MTTWILKNSLSLGTYISYLHLVGSQGHSYKVDPCNLYGRVI